MTSTSAARSLSKPCETSTPATPLSHVASLKKPKSEVSFSIPKEGALLWVDVMAIPKDAPRPDNAHAFIDFLLRPDIIADVSNFISYANANQAATKLVDEEIREDPGIYPPRELRARLVTTESPPAETQRLRTRAWTRATTGR